MFIGHFALGFAAKPLAPRLSLGTTFLAAQFIDLIWPTLLLLGVERVRIAPGHTAVTPLAFEHYPWSHSLLAACGWGLLLAAACLLARKGLRASGLVGLLVVSHWLLDAIVHAPDLPLLPGGSERIGLGLWQSLEGTLVLEGALVAAGLALYLRSTRATDRTGRWALAGLVALLLVIYLANLFAPPPESVAVIGWVGQAQWLLVAWGYWVDRHRGLRATPASTGA